LNQRLKRLVPFPDAADNKQEENHTRNSRLPVLGGMHAAGRTICSGTVTMACLPADPLIAKLIQRVRDRDPLVRLNAVGALRLHGARAAAAIPELQKLVTDRDPRVRSEAARALNRLRQPAA